MTMGGIPGSFDSLLFRRMDGSHSGFRDRSKGSKNAVQLASLFGNIFWLSTSETGGKKVGIYDTHHLYKKWHYQVGDKCV